MYAEPRHVAHGSSARVTWGLWIRLAALMLAMWLPLPSYLAWKSWRDSRPDVLPRIDLNAGHNFIYNLRQLTAQHTIWFTYPFGSERARLALQKDSSGTIRTVIASCTACYSFRKEHQFTNGRLICGRCRHAMRLGNANDKLSPTSCVAVPVPFSTEDQLLTVRASDVEQRLRELQSGKSPNQ